MQDATAQWHSHNMLGSEYFVLLLLTPCYPTRLKQCLMNKVRQMQLDPCTRTHVGGGKGGPGLACSCQEREAAGGGRGKQLLCVGMAICALEINPRPHILEAACK